MAKKPAIEDWHRADIIAAVRKTGTNLQQLSRANNLGRTTLSNALYGPCPRYERIIATHLQTTPQTIWPSRYHADGSPKSGRGERGIGRYTVKTKSSDANYRNNTPAGKSRNEYSDQPTHADMKTTPPGQAQAFDKRMALDVIEDAMFNTDTPYGLGIATGLCGAFYMCGLLSTEEWMGLLARVNL